MKQARERVCGFCAKKEAGNKREQIKKEAIKYNNTHIYLLHTVVRMYVHTYEESKTK